MPIFTKLLAISIDASNVLGSSSKFTMRRKEGWRLVFSTLISFDVSEKNATSLPARKKERMKRIMMVKISMVVAAVVIAKKIKKCVPGPKTE